MHETPTRSRVIHAAARPTSGRAAVVLALLLVPALACSDDATAPGEQARVSHFAVAANPNNVLSAIATFDATGVDSVRVLFSIPGGVAQATPFTRDVASGRIAVLGLRPRSAYHLRVEGYGRNGIVTSSIERYITGELPDFLRDTKLTNTQGASTGYTLTSVYDGSSAFAVAFDSTGAVAWYRRFDEGVPPLEVKQQPDGNITMYLGNSHGGDLVEGRYVEIAPDGNVVRTITGGPGAFIDPHELVVLTRDGEYDGALYFTISPRHFDMSSRGGVSDSVVTGHQLVREDADGTRHVLFDAWNHFTLDDNVELHTYPDFDHPNAIAIDHDGNYLVSWRNLDVITKHDASTGALLWTLAAPFARVASDFAIIDDPLEGHSAQHSVRVTEAGHILLFDNGTKHSPPQTRAVAYDLDPVARTARLVFEFRHTPLIYTEFTGSVQPLVNGNTLIGYTWASPLAVTEVAPSGVVVWEAKLESRSQNTPYRFIRIRSLYSYERP